MAEDLGHELNSSVMSPQQSPLLALPRELRDGIYQYLLAPTGAIRLSPQPLSKIMLSECIAANHRFHQEVEYNPHSKWTAHHPKLKFAGRIKVESCLLRTETESRTASTDVSQPAYLRSIGWLNPKQRHNNRWWRAPRHLVAIDFLRTCRQINQEAGDVFWSNRFVMKSRKKDFMRVMALLSTYAAEHIRDLEIDCEMHDVLWTRWGQQYLKRFRGLQKLTTRLAVRQYLPHSRGGVEVRRDLGCNFWVTPQQGALWWLRLSLNRTRFVASPSSGLQVTVALDMRKVFRELLNNEEERNEADKFLKQLKRALGYRFVTNGVVWDFDDALELSSWTDTPEIYHTGTTPSFWRQVRQSLESLLGTAV